MSMLDLICGNDNYQKQGFHEAACLINYTHIARHLAKSI